jgi:ankyrin repeat protein
MCLLLEKGSDKYETNTFTKSAMLMAVEKGNLNLIKKIFLGESSKRIEKHCMKHSKKDNSKVESCLHIACNYGHLQVVKFLIEEKGVDIDATEVTLNNKLEIIVS